LQEQVPAAQLQQLVADVASREVDPYRAAEQLLPAVLAADLVKVAP
jgi:hypothetical protein